jgi:hypothetical protein
VRKPLILLTVATVISILTSLAFAELGSDNPDDSTLLAKRIDEATTPPGNPSGIFDIPVSDDPGQTYQPVKRVPRGQFGVVGPFKLSNGLTAKDLDNLVYPDATTEEKSALVEGLQFFTMFHNAGEGLGPINNQPACIGCHLNAAEAVNSKGLLRGPNCDPKSNCLNVSNVTRASRSTPTNFEFTSLDPDTGGGRAPDNNLTELLNTGAKRRPLQPLVTSARR